MVLAGQSVPDGGASARQVFRILEGRWSLRRSVPGVASLRGHAQFAPTEGRRDALCYAERGDLCLEVGGTYAATRRYFYSLTGSRILVAFGDGPNRGAILHDLYFAQFDRFPDAWIARHEHSCHSDVYELAMTVVGADLLVSHYSIHGPRKRYTMLSVYERLPSGSPHGGELAGLATA